MSTTEVHAAKDHQTDDGGATVTAVRIGGVTPPPARPAVSAPPVIVQATIDYPTDIGYLVEDGFLVAYGTSWRPHVVAILQNYHTQVIYMSRSLRSPQESAADGQGNLWAASFLGVPEGTYSLSVFESPGLVLAQADVLLKKVAAVSAATIIPFETSVTSPSSNAFPVCKSFVAYGTATNDGTAVGTMTDNNTNPHTVYNGTQLTGGTNWSIQFSNLVPDKPYTLAVSVGGVAAQPVTGLTVANCIKP
jgi:hypothetical protein